MKTWIIDKIWKVDIVFWSYCCVLFVWNNWWRSLQIKLSTILAVKWVVFRTVVQSIINTPARLLQKSCHSDFADTSCYWYVAYFRNWRYPIVRIWQRVAWGDWVTAGTYIFVSRKGLHFDCPRMVHIFSSTFHDFHNAVDPVVLLQFGWWRVERNCRKVQ
jgi:hypothetical protein